MNVLIVGNGGREHALAWKIKQSPRADRIGCRHAADRRLRRRADLDREPDPLGFERLVQLRRPDAGLHDAGLGAGVVVEQAVEIFRGVDDQPFADGLARTPRATRSSGSSTPARAAWSVA